MCRWKTFLSLLPLALVIGGCAGTNPNKLRPIPPTDFLEPFSTKVQEPTTLENINKALDVVIGQMAEKTREKANQSWGLSDTSLAGGIAATLGFLAEKTGLANTGLGVAGIGLAGNQHYRPQDQLNIHLSTTDRLVCIRNRLVGLTDSKWEAAFKSNGITPAQLEELASAHRDAISAIQNTLNKYNRGLYSIQTPDSIRADIQALVDERLKTSGNKDAATLSLGQKLRKDRGINGNDIVPERALNEFIGLRASLLACNIDVSSQSEKR